MLQQQYGGGGKATLRTPSIQHARSEE